jgi:NAD+ synthase (glutamine-hydrolysing)
MAKVKPPPERSEPMPGFFSPYSHQFARLAVCVPQVAVADPVKNGDQVAAMVADGDRD